MSRKTEILTAACTLGCAVSIGFVMQSGELAEMRYGSGELLAMSTTPLVGKPVDPVRVVDLSINKDEEILEVDEIKLTSAKVDALNHITNDFVDPIQISAPAESVVPSLENDIAVGPACELTARAEPTAGAMINLTLEAPCFGGERVTVIHEGLTFSQNLSDSGNLKVLMPALVKDVRVSMTFLNGESIAAFTTVGSVPLYDRVVLQWQGNTGAQIHAREFGADYGSDGHVWSGAARNFSAVVGGTGGFLTTLGDPAGTSPMLAEVYTFPATFSEADGAIDLTVETEVTVDNCGNEIQARSFQYSGGKEVSSQFMSLAVPNCSAVGNYLVLNNLLQNLTVARK